MSERALIPALDDWRKQAQACQRQMERRLLDDDVSDDERRIVQETRRSALGLQAGLLRLIDRQVSSGSRP